MCAVSTNQITDILHFNDKYQATNHISNKKIFKMVFKSLKNLDSRKTNIAALKQNTSKYINYFKLLPKYLLVRIIAKFSHYH